MNKNRFAEQNKNNRTIFEGEPQTGMSSLERSSVPDLWTHDLQNSQSDHIWPRCDPDLW